MDNGMVFEQHEMVVSQEYENGAREMLCPTCGRRMVVQQPPAFQRIVLDPGDEAALHTGDTGPRPGDLTDPYLAPFAGLVGDLLDHKTGGA